LFEWIIPECESVFNPTGIHRMKGGYILASGHPTETLMIITAIRFT